MQEKQRINIVVNILYEIQITIISFQKEVNKLKKWMNNENKRVTDEGNHLTKSLETIRLREETKKQIEETKKSWIHQVEEKSDEISLFSQCKKEKYMLICE